MELKDFIDNALTQIMEGVSSAQKKIDEFGGVINPHMHGGKQVQLGLHYTSEGSASVVKFDVALSVTEGTNTKAGISVLGGAINLGAGGQSSNQNTVVSRLEFSVPIVLPSSQRR